MSDIRHDMHRDPADLEREADRARANVEHTLEALEHKFSPGQLLDQALNMAKSNGGEFGRNLTTQVRNNPVPLLLTGIGLTWLMAASDRPPRYRGSDDSSGTYGSTGAYGGYTGSSVGSSAGDKMSSAAGSAKSAAGGVADRARSAAHSVSDAAHDARERMSHAAGQTRSALGNMAGAGRDTAARWGSATRQGAQSLADTYDYLRREQPLVLGALAVAAGAALGSLLPHTRREDEWVGEYSEETKERLKREGRERADQAKTAAADAAEAARQAASSGQQSGETGQSTEAGRPDYQSGSRI